MHIENPLPAAEILRAMPTDNFSDEEVRMVYHKLNQRPRKRLGYRTPHEVHYSTALQLI